MVSQNALLVLDDLPDLTQDQRLLERLAGLAVSWWNSGGRILSTSQFPPSVRLENILGAGLSEFVVPAMKERELVQLLTLASAPASLNTPKSAAMLVGLTRGHPVLVGAAIQWLIRNDWDLNQGFVPLVTGEATSQVMVEARIQVRRLVGSDQARDLLNRLSMVTSSFNRDMVWALGAVEPRIDRPIDRLDELVGPWVLKLENSKYEVSPLLQSGSQEYIHPELRKDIHSAIAHEWLRGKTLGIDEAFQVCIHLAGAEQWLGLATVLLQVMNPIETTRYAEVSKWATWFFRPRNQWPDQIPGALRITVRAMQVKVQILLHSSASEYESDLEQLIGATTTDEGALAALYARMQTGVTLEPAPPELTARRAIQVARMIQERDLPLKSEMPPDPELLMWSASLKIKEQSQIRGVLDVIRGLTLEERRVAFSLNVGAQMAATFTEMCYSIEADKPPDTQDWSGVLAILDEIESVGNSEGAEVLRWAAIRTRAMVLADFLDNTEKAISLLEESFGSAEGVYKYLLKFTQACILVAKGKNDLAFDSFSEALAINTDTVFPFYYSDITVKI
jgi:hypothetical protein